MPMGETVLGLVRSEAGTAAGGVDEGEADVLDRVGLTWKKDYPGK